MSTLNEYKCIIWFCFLYGVKTEGWLKKEKIKNIYFAAYGLQSVSQAEDLIKPVFKSQRAKKDHPVVSAG